MMQKRVLTLLALGTLVLFGCSSQSTAPTSSGSSGGSAAEIKMTELAFTPNTITAAAGAPLAIKVTNAGTTKHDLTVEGADGPAKVEVDPGQSGNLTVKFSQAGTYKFACKVPGHEEAGMKGTITVK